MPCFGVVDALSEGSGPAPHLPCFLFSAAMELEKTRHVWVGEEVWVVCNLKRIQSAGKIILHTVQG